MASYNFDLLKGVIIPDTSTTLAEVQAEYKDAFGEGLITTSDTPQGVLINAETTSRNNVLRIIATILNQINPNQAGGIFLDAIGLLTNVQRQAASYTLVPSVVLTGSPTTIVPEGSQATLGTDGEIFQSLSTVVLDDSGEAIVDFQAINPGSIAVVVGQLNTVAVNQVLGWETVYNPVEGEIGSNTQSDIAFRLYRKKTLATQGSASLMAMYAGVTEVKGVIGVFGQENPTSSTVILNNVTMSPHSFYFCVDGGLDNDVANGLFYKKSGGAAYVNGAPGATPISVELSYNFTGITTPVIYTILFDRPEEIPILAKVTVKFSNSVSDIVGAVKQAILDYASGALDQEPGFTIGESVSSFELSGAITSEYPSIYVKSVQTALASSPIFSSDEIEIGVYQKATINESSISVTVE